MDEEQKKKILKPKNPKHQKIINNRREQLVVQEKACEPGGKNEAGTRRFKKMKVRRSMDGALGGDRSLVLKLWGLTR